jgi:hypothetical protein
MLIQAYRGGGSIPTTNWQAGTRSNRVVNISLRPFYPGKDGTPYEGGWLVTLGPVWTGRENLAFAGIQSPNRRARSELLYRLL